MRNAADLLKRVVDEGSLQRPLHLWIPLGAVGFRPLPFSLHWDYASNTTTLLLTKIVPDCSQDWSILNRSGYWAKRLESERADALLDSQFVTQSNRDGRSGFRSVAVYGYAAAVVCTTPM